MSNRRSSVIVTAARTPVGAFFGGLSTVPAPKLGAVVIKEVVNRAGIKPEDVDEVVMGNVITAGEGQAPARQATIFAGLPVTTPAMTINKVCGSGLKSVMLAEQFIALGDSDIVVAGGQENMSLAPYALFKARTGYRMGNGELVDLMIKDGLWDVYNDFHMGEAADMCARECNITREEQDEFAAESYRRALKAMDEGWFKEEIVPVEVPGRKGQITVVEEDESPRTVKFDKIPKLKPAFTPDGTVTAANASSINDGAAAVLVMAEEKASELGLKPLARIVTHAQASTEPKYFTKAPVYAMNKALEKAGLKVEDIDLWEINEAFAVVTLLAIKEMNIDPAKVNVHGGAVSIGHPIGASGARILTTLLYALKKYNKKYGMASLCIGGGEAVAMIVENLA